MAKIVRRWQPFQLCKEALPFAYESSTDRGAEGAICLQSSGSWLHRSGKWHYSVPEMSACPLRQAGPASGPSLSRQQHTHGSNICCHASKAGVQGRRRCMEDTLEQCSGRRTPFEHELHTRPSTRSRQRYLLELLQYPAIKAVVYVLRLFRPVHNS